MQQETTKQDTPSDCRLDTDLGETLLQGSADEDFRTAAVETVANPMQRV